EVERLHIHRVLDTHGGNKAAAARALGINVKTLRFKLRTSMPRRDPGAARG
ncbi:MAG: hypothetical protein HY722_10950, partial [Planctomycetes bacterium]|nr:hypothetical protein [Planctomycetota bacterium]